MVAWDEAKGLVDVFRWMCVVCIDNAVRLSTIFGAVIIELIELNECWENKFVGCEDDVCSRCHVCGWFWGYFGVLRWKRPRVGSSS